MNKVHMMNVTRHQCFSWETEQETITFADIIENIQEFEPQTNVRNISFMWNKPENKKWLFINNNFNFKFTHQISSDSSEEVTDLWIKYKIFNEPTISIDSRKEIG